MNLYDEDKALEELERAIGSGNPESIGKALAANSWPLFCSHFGLLMKTLESLPIRVLERYPVLRALHPMTILLARTSRPFKPLIEQEEARTMTPVELDTFTLVQMVAFRFSGDVAAALMFAKRLEDRILNIRAESRMRPDGPLWYYHDQIGLTLLLAGDSSRALFEFGTSLQLGEISKQPDASRVALGHSALAHAARGSLDSAGLALAEIALQSEPTPAHVESSMMTERTAAALIGVERMEGGVDGLLSELGQPDSVQPTWPFALLARARFLVADQRPGDALEAIHLAANAHPAQYGSIATDIITSMSIDALSAVGDTQAAWRLAESSAQTGLMTRFATIRIALHDSRFEMVHDLLRRTSNHTLSPGHKAEFSMLSAWLEVAQTGDLDRHAAAQIARLATKGDIRRLLATMPGQLIDRVSANLSAADAVNFDAVTAGLPRVEMQFRPTLTPSELRVLNALPTHSTTAAIATAFHVSPNTIKSQLKALYRKLGCSTRDEALTAAARLRLVAADDNGDAGDARMHQSQRERFSARAY